MKALSFLLTPKVGHVNTVVAIISCLGCGYDSLPVKMRNRFDVTHVDALGVAFTLNGQSAIGVHLENSVRTGEGVSQLRAQLVIVKQYDVVSDVVVVVETLIVFSLG
jgi:hypothetical protein